MANNYDHSLISSSYFFLLLAGVIPSLLIIPTTSNDDDNVLLAPFCDTVHDGFFVDIVNYASTYGVGYNKQYYYANYTGLLSGLSLCRGDISSDNNKCMACVSDVTFEMSEKKCTMDEHGTVVFRELCFVKYSAKEFFGEIDYVNVNKSCEDKVDVAEGRSFPEGTHRFLDGLIENANASNNLFASANYSTTTRGNFHGLVQCTMDFSESNQKDRCSDCLRIGVSYILSDCKNRIGGKYYSGSCIVIYRKIDD